jgi:molecular chaperone DnaK (HSP70)
MSNAIGIDFGTSKSYLAYIDRSIISSAPPNIAIQDKLIPSDNDFPYFRNSPFQGVPTVVNAFLKDEDLQVYSGFPAIDPNTEHFQPGVLISDLKERTQNVGTSRIIMIGEREYPIEGFVARFLYEMRHRSKELVNTEIDPKGITITVPAKSRALQRITIQYAATIAQFKGEISIVEEPVAAFLYYRHTEPDFFYSVTPKYALVVDFGGGTCDIAVVRYDNNHLPIVVGRAMGEFGGERIDELILKNCWLDNPWFNRSDSNRKFTLSTSDYDQLSDFQNRALLAYVRLAKEDLSQRPEVDPRVNISDISHREIGEWLAPTFSRNDLNRLLKEVLVEVKYADDPVIRENSIFQHVENLIALALGSARIKRSNIKKLIFAGGSINLPGFTEMVVDLLKSNHTKVSDPPNHQLQAVDILHKNSDICVAGGAAIHQLYKYSEKKEWKGAVTSTLSSNYYLIHNSNQHGAKEESILGKEGQELPIDKRGFRKSRLIYPAYKPPKGDLYITLRQGLDTLMQRSELHSEPIFIDEKYCSSGLSAFIKVIMIEYLIDDFGVLFTISWTPGNFLLGLNHRAKIESEPEFIEPEIKDKIGIQTDLTKLLPHHPNNQNRISLLRRLFIPLL